MDKFSKKVYKFLLSQPNHGFRSDMYDPAPFTKQEFSSACEYLVRCGYAKRIKSGYMLTHEGIHKRELDLIAFRKNFFSRYVTGIVTGIVIAIIANLLTEPVRSLLSEVFRLLETLL